MSNKNKIKGYNFENTIIKDLRSIGLKVERLGQANQADMIIDGFGLGEAKCKKNGMKGIYDILGSNHFAVVKWQSVKNRGKQPIVFMTYDIFKSLIKEIV